MNLMQSVSNRPEVTSDFLSVISAATKKQEGELRMILQPTRSFLIRADAGD